MILREKGESGMKRVWASACLVLCLSLVTAACGTSGSAGEAIVIKAGIGLNEDHPQGQALNRFKEIVEEKSGGRIQVRPYFSAQLGDDLKMTEALQAGVQEVTIPSTSPLVGIVPEFGIFDLPFVFDEEEEADAVLDGALGQKILDKLPEHGLVGLTYWENGYRNLTNSRRPVKRAEDFRGLKIRTMQTDVHLDAFKALGSNPTPMPFSEVFTALESGTVDGQENPLATIVSNKFYEVQDYLSLTKHVYTPFVFLVSKSFWDRLSPEDQQLIREAAIEAGKYERELNRKVNAESLEELKKQGIKINEVSPEERERMKQIIQPVIEKYRKKLGEDLVSQLFEEVEKARNR